MSCTKTETLGVYVLGALEPAERADFEAHLSGCSTCRAELVQLAPLPGLLNQLSLSDFMPDEPAEPRPVAEPGEPVADVVELAPRRRLRRVAWLAAAAVLVIALAGLGFVLANSRSAPDAVAGVTWSGTDAKTGVHGEVQLQGRPWGTEFKVGVSNVSSGQRCELVVYGKDGGREVAGWWLVDGTSYDGASGVEKVPGATSIAQEKIDHLEIVNADKAVLVNIPPPAK